MSVIKRSGPKGVRWAVKIKVKGQQRWVGTYDTKTEAKRVEREELLKTVQPSPHDATCDSFPAKWLALRPARAPSRTSTTAWRLSGSLTTSTASVFPT
jgi:hypothetical protein